MIARITATTCGNRDTPREYIEEERAKMYRVIWQTLDGTKPSELDIDHLD